MNRPEFTPYHRGLMRDLPDDSRAEELADAFSVAIINRSAAREQVAAFANGALERYNRQPKRTVGQKRIAKELIRETAAKMLESPQDMNVMDDTWKEQETRQVDTEELQETFSKLVKKDSLDLIEKKWKDVEPEQLAQLVRIYADNNNPQQEFAKDMITSYFKGPSDRQDRVYPRAAARLKFAFSLLDLLGEDEAFREGMKIDLFATDILPKEPMFIEQIMLLSLPSKEEQESGLFQTLLVIECVNKQAMSLSSQDFTKYVRDLERLVKTDKIKPIWEERKERVTKEVGSPDRAIAINDAARTAMGEFLHFLRVPLTEEKKQELIGKWPFDDAFDPAHPLNQKFERVLSNQLARSSRARQDSYLL